MKHSTLQRSQRATLFPLRHAEQTESKSRNHAASGFTLVEILVVLAIIAILAAILLPALKSAGETGRQANCASNLQQIYTAVRLYYDDEKRYPGTLAVLLPAASNLNDTAATPTTKIDGTDCGSPNSPAGTCTNTQGTGHLKGTDGLLCLDDDHTADKPRSSYGDISTQITTGNTGEKVDTDMSRFVWNYYGYKPDGTSTERRCDKADGTATGCPTDYYEKAFETQARYLLDPSQPLGATNPVDDRKLPRMLNRYAPPYTIITHCIYHRIPTANNLASPNDLYKVPADDTGAKDIILRLDGSAKQADVSGFNAGGAADKSKWVQQNTSP